MDFNRQNNQANTSFRAVDAPAPVHTNNGKKARRKFNLKGRNGTGWAIVLVAVVMIVFGLLWFFKVNGSSELSQVNSKEYQAIFLSNGQVYFGKLVTLNDDYAKITHIFYLQVKQTVQPNQSSSDSQDQNPTLVKLGSEIHAPEDEMMINRSQIVFWENLKSNGKVSEAIQRYYSSGSSNTQTQSPASSQNSSSSTESTPQTNSSSTNTPATTNTTNTESSGSNSSTGSTNTSAAKP